MIFIRKHILIVILPLIWMFNLTRHEGIGIQQEHIETSLRTEIYLFAAILRTWIFGCIVYFPAAGSLEFWLWGRIFLSPIHDYFSLLLRCLISFPIRNTVTATATPAIPARTTTPEVEPNHTFQIEVNKITPMTKAAI